MLAKAVEQCPDEAWTDEAGHAPAWEQVYHALFWFNAWLRDWAKPIEYPEFHIKEALDLKHRAGTVIDRRQTLGYLAKVRADYEVFMAGVDDAGLLADGERVRAALDDGRPDPRPGPSHPASRRVPERHPEHDPRPTGHTGSATASAERRSPGTPRRSTARRPPA